MLIFILFSIFLAIILSLCLLHPQLTSSGSSHMGYHMLTCLITWFVPFVLWPLLGSAITPRSTVIFTLVLNYTYFLVQIVCVTWPSTHVMSFDNCLNPTTPSQNLTIHLTAYIIAQLTGQSIKKITIWHQGTRFVHILFLSFSNNYNDCYRVSN